MKRILITTDFSDHSKHTLKYVLNLMGETGIPCHIILLNTYLVQHVDPNQVIKLNDELKQKSRAGLLAERTEALKIVSNSNITIETASHMGSLHNVVLQLLQRGPIDLVAMGKNGGKNVESVGTMLKEKHCPLLITYLTAS